MTNCSISVGTWFLANRKFQPEASREQTDFSCEGKVAYELDNAHTVAANCGFCGMKQLSAGHSEGYPHLN